MRAKKSLALVSLALAGLLVSANPAIAATSDPGITVTRNIIGGHDAKQPYPGMASLQVNIPGSPGFHICGASLVFHKIAVTNAHCVTEFPSPAPQPASLFSLRIGSADRSIGGVVVQVVKILPHADWDWASGSDPVADIALLFLADYVQLQPFEIATRHNHSTVREIGWGVTEPNGEGPPLPLALQELETKLRPTAQCAGGGITAGEICLNNPHGTDGFCHGDSGGPALQRVESDRWSIIGGASRGAGDDEFCGTSKAIYTDVTFYRGWIFQVARTGVVPPSTTGITAGAPRAASEFHWIKSKLTLAG